MKKYRLLKCWPLLLALLLVSITALADVTIPAEVTVIEARAFLNDKSLTGKLDLPDTVTTIGDQAFEGCTGLTGQLFIPVSVTHIGRRAFANCTGFTGTVYIPANVAYVSPDAFDGTNLRILDGSGNFSTDTDLPDDPIITDTDLPDGIAYRMNEEGAVITGYRGNPDGVLTLPKTINGVKLVGIDEGAFMNCSGLTGSVIIPDTVTYIGSHAFFGCSSLDGTVVIPASVKTIGDFAFYECLSLTGSLTIPDSVTNVGESAFAFCESMTGKLTLPASVTLGKRCFQGSGFTGSLTVPATMKLGAHVFVGTSLNITWEAPGFAYEQSGSVVTITGWNGPAVKDMIIPSRLNNGMVTGIGAEAFADVGLTGTITFPSSILYIGNSAFRSNPGVTGLSFTKGLTTIAAHAFADCTGLTGTITLPSSVTVLDPAAFAGTNVNVVIATAE